MQHRDWLPFVQGLRAVAVIAVMAYHSGLPVPGGFVGVDVFFVISGFVITGMLQREWHTAGRIRFGAFFRRRFQRLTPALAVMVGVTLLLSVLFLSPLGQQQTAAFTGIGAMLISANVVIAKTTGGYFDAPAETNPLLHTWSLSVEEQFYVVFPLVLALGWMLVRKYRVTFVPMVIAGLIVVTSFALAYLGSRASQPLGGGFLAGFYSPATRAWEFAVGALIALVGAHWQRVWGHLSWVFAVSGAAVLLASLWLIDDTKPFPGGWTLLPVGGTALIIIGGLIRPSRVTRVLAATPFTWTGDRSYSLYLWHWPFIVFALVLWPGNVVAAVTACLLSVIPAYCSYRWVEQPLRQRRFTRRGLFRAVAVTLIAPLALSGGLWWFSQDSAWSAQAERVAAATVPFHIDHMSECDVRVPLGSYPDDQCTWNRQATGRPIYLVGDSQAGALSEGVIGAGEDLNRPVMISTTSGCPFVDVVFGIKGEVDSSCGRYVQGTLAYLNAATPGTVIIANSDWWWSIDGISIGTTSDNLSTDAAVRLRRAESALTNMVSQLESHGQQVVLVQKTPRWELRHWNPTRCTVLVTSSGNCSDTMPAAENRVGQGPTRDVINRVAKTTGATVFDTWMTLCPNDVCVTTSEDFLRYRDSGHISVQQSQAFGPEIAALLSSSSR